MANHQADWKTKSMTEYTGLLSALSPLPHYAIELGASLQPNPFNLLLVVPFVHQTSDLLATVLKTQDGVNLTRSRDAQTLLF